MPHFVTNTQKKRKKERTLNSIDFEKMTTTTLTTTKEEEILSGPSQTWRETRGFVPRDRLRFVRVCARVFHRVASESRKQKAAKRKRNENETMRACE